jgi:hypothetical protein
MRRTAWCSIEDQFSSRGCTSRSQTKESALWSDTQQRCVTGVGGLFSDVLQEEAIRELEGDSVCKRVSVGGAHGRGCLVFVCSFPRRAGQQPCDD